MKSICKNKGEKNQLTVVSRAGTKVVQIKLRDKTNSKVRERDLTFIEEECDKSKQNGQ